MISVSEGHLISERVRQVLIKDVDEVYEVMVHIDPEDDAHASPCANLPLREELLKRLDEAWNELPERLMVKKINLHYLNGRIRIEVVLPISLLETRNQQELADQFVRAGTTLENISDIQVLFA